MRSTNQVPSSTQSANDEQTSVTKKPTDSGKKNQAPSAHTISNPIDEAQKFISPAWPLQNTVAVNPLWFKKENSFHDVLSELQLTLHQSLFMSVAYYQTKYKEGEITCNALQKSLQIAQKKYPHAPQSTEDLVAMSQKAGFISKNLSTFAEFTSPLHFHKITTQELGKHAAAFLDEHQSLVPYPGTDQTFWEGWLSSLQYDLSLEKWGLKDCLPLISRFEGIPPREAIQTILAEMKLESSFVQYLYLQRLLATSVGWASQFKYIEWQRDLGYLVNRQASLLDFLAVRMLYDFAIFKHIEKNAKHLTTQWVESLHDCEQSFLNKDQTTSAFLVWQLASEISYQDRIIHRLPKDITQPQPASVNMVFCIDTRSEMLRRHIEATSEKIETIGFAGFFGLPIQYKPLNEKTSSQRLPVLLPAAYQSQEESRDKDESAKVGHTLVHSYFRNLRKAPYASFLFVELFGILSVGKFLKRTWSTLLQYIQKNELPTQFKSSLTSPSMPSSIPSGKVERDELAARLCAILRHMGIIGRFGEIVLIVGHGAKSKNNAFQSALNCGACGGHAGDINARILVDLLNDPSMRQEVKRKGIDIPSKTYFVAAIHETVTDEIYLLDEEKIPAPQRQEILGLQETLQKASRSTRLERQTARSATLDPLAFRRSENWAETRPEWGLSGNACFIIAPRTRSKPLNLGSRAFLHDYEWTKDDGFQTLELILTAPMLVTNWINMQYYFSVVAPDYFGSGNKVLHNLTNENGVVEGNGGDLRIGLPIQSVHDGKKFVHDPLRLSVFIEAPRDAIETIIEKHAVVKDLVENEWLHILHIEPETNIVFRRLNGALYQTTHRPS